VSASSQRFWHRVLTWSGPLLLIFCAVYKIVEWTTERWWFESLGYVGQFDSLMRWRTGSFAFGAALFAGWLGINAHLAWRNAAVATVPLGFFEKEESGRFLPLSDRLFLDLYRRRLTVLSIGLLSWLAGLGCAARYGIFLRAANLEATGKIDMASGFDVGYFLFELPFWNWLSRFSLSAIVAALFMVGAIYFYEELLGPALRHRPVHRAVAKHLGMLWALLLLWKGTDCLLVIPNTFVGTGNVAARVFDGADMRFGWTVTALFALLAPVAAVFSAVAITRELRLQTFLFGMGWIFAASTLPFLLPLVVGHSESDLRWQGDLSRHIRSTRAAWGLDEVRRDRVRVPASASFSEHIGSPAAASRMPVAIWPPQDALKAMNDRLRDEQSSWRVEAVKLGSNGSKLVYSGIAFPPARPFHPDWRSRHVIEGDGRLLQIDASAASSAGQPIFILDQKKPLLIRGEDAELSDSYSSTQRQRTDPSEVPFIAEGTNEDWGIVPGDDDALGVTTNTWVQRLALSLRFFDFGLLNRLQPNDIALWHKSATERCEAVAPFLAWHSDGVPASITDGSGSQRLVWLTAGLVWSDDYPDSATPAAPGTAPPGVNYGRQVALGVVDAVTGQTSLFALDEDEPFLALYRRTFPTLFAPSTAIPSALRHQVRAAPDMLMAQCLIWGRYHQDDTAAWVKTADVWRPLLDGPENRDGSLRPFLDRQGREWQLMAYSTLQGVPGPKGASSPLSAILGAEQSNLVDNRGRSEFVEWKADEQQGMPNLITDSSPISPWVTIAPRFNEQGMATGLLALRGEVEDGKISSNITAGATQSRKSQVKAGALVLSVGLLGTGDDDIRLSSGPIDTSSSQLKAARRAWLDLVAARRKGDWSAVASAEKRLGGSLNPQ
jgi:hypothetical protein